MLSRVADGLYWMARYLERAENVARLLVVTEDLSTELAGLHADLAAAEWEDFLATFPGAPSPAVAGASALAYLQTFLQGDHHPYSVAFALRKARENARSVREALTMEVFLTLNEAHRELDGRTRRELRDLPSCRTVLSGTQRAILSVVGAMDHTLSRDEGWQFLQLGLALERAFRTAFVLRAKLPALIGRGERGRRADLEVQYTRWRGLLRAVSSLENYRQSHGARLEARDVVRFLLFDPTAPRALRHGTAEVAERVRAIAGGNGGAPPLRVAGKLLARLSYEGEDVLGGGDLLGFLDHVLGELGALHDALAAEYFAI